MTTPNHVQALWLNSAPPDFIPLMKSRLLLPLLFALPALAYGVCGRSEVPGDGRVHVSCWTNWAGKEAEAMQQVVDAFNRSQDRIFVELVSVSDITRQMALATAGGNPPDLVGLNSYDLATVVDCGALEPLEPLMRADGIDPAAWMARFAPVLADACRYRGRIYSQPIAAYGIALHWNKRLFREAGLDPERPPRTFEEFVDYAHRLSRRDPKTGALVQMGFLPQVPWSDALPSYGLWMGGRFLANDEIMIGHDPGFGRMMRWIEGISREYGVGDLMTFASGLGSYDSPQNPFLAGKVAMIFDGDYLANFVRQFAPGFEYGVAPWPEFNVGEASFTVAFCDPLMIPRGARHGAEAWQFLKYMVSPNLAAGRRDELQGVERLCFLHCKSSPLREWSPAFGREQPNPFIAVFRQLLTSPRAVDYPNMGIWLEYQREFVTACDKVRLLEQSPDDALAHVQQRIERSWQRHRAALERRERAEK